MKPKSALYAKYLLLVSIALGLTSAYFGREFSADLKSAQSKKAKLTQEDQKLSKAYSELSAVLHKDASPISLDTTFATTVLTLLQNRIEYGVTVSGITPPKAPGGAAFVEVGATADKVPGTSLQSIKIEIKGTYLRYAQFREYLSEIRKLPVSIVSLKVDGNAYELSLRVFGN